MRPEQSNDLQEVERLAAHWLWLGNRASERGERAKAERHYQKGQKWHDRMIEILATKPSTKS